MTGSSRVVSLTLTCLGLWSCASGPQRTTSYVSLRRADSSIVNRSIDALLRQWTPFLSLWEVGNPGQFVITIDGVPRIAQGFVLAYQRDSIPQNRKCASSRYVHRLIAWIPLPDSVGIEAVWADSPGMPRRADQVFRARRECEAMGGVPDTQATAGTYKMVERTVQTPGYLAVSGKLWLDAGIITFRDRPCPGKGIRPTLRNFEIGCAERWYTVRIEAGMVRSDSLRARNPVQRRLHIDTYMVPGRMLYVNCARRNSAFLCPGY